MFNFMVEPILSDDLDNPEIRLVSEYFRDQQIIDQDGWLDEGQLKQCYCPYCNSNDLKDNHGMNLNSTCTFNLKKEHDSRLSLNKKPQSSLSKILARFTQELKIINLNSSKYGFATLSCFSFNVLISCFYSVKLVVHSIFSPENEDSMTEQVFAAKYKSTVANTDGSNYLLVSINEFITCDVYQQFTNRRTINLIAASLLLPPTMNKLWCLAKLLCKIGGDRGKVVEVNKLKRSSNEGIKHFDSGDNKEDKEDAPNNEQTINVVQLNVAYLNSLKTTTSCWIELVKDGWNHVHSLQKFDKETNLSIKICLSKGILPSSIDFKTKMYSYNMIQFNDCYSKYFKSMPGIDSDDKGDSGFTIEKFNNNDIEVSNNKNNGSMIVGNKLFKLLETGRILPDSTKLNSCQDIECYTTPSGRSNMYDSLARNLLSNEIKNTLDQTREQPVDDIEVDFKMPNGRKKSQSFVARPIHRLDLNEMAWLIILIAFLYWSVLLNTIGPCIFAIITETSSKNSDQITWSNSIMRWSQTLILQLLFFFASFDLFNFVSSCLICISRAKYVGSHLKNLKELCATIRCENLNNSKNSNEKQDDDDFDYDKDYDYFMEQLKLLDANEEAGITMKNIDRFKDYFHNKQSTVESIQSHYNLNRRLESLIDRCLLIQKELDDLKNFFAIYLDFEIAFKVLCSAFSLSALLDQRNTSEMLYILVNTLTGATPIIMTLAMAAFIEHEFRIICKEMSQLLVYGTRILTIKNIRQLMLQSNHLAAKSNRSFTIAGNFSLSMGSLISVTGWVATSLVLLRR